MNEFLEKLSEYLNQWTKLSRLPFPMWLGIIQSTESPHRTKKWNLLSACWVLVRQSFLDLHAPVPRLSDSDWHLHHWLSDPQVFLSLWLTDGNLGTSQPPKLCEPILYNKLRQREKGGYHLLILFLCRTMTNTRPSQRAKSFLILSNISLYWFFNSNPTPASQHILPFFLPSVIYRHFLL